MRSDARCLAGGGGGRQGLAGRVAGLKRGVQRKIVPKAKRPSTTVSQSRVQYATPLGSYPDAVAHRKDALKTSVGATVKIMQLTTNRISTKTMPPAKTTRACLW